MDNVNYKDMAANMEAQLISLYEEKALVGNVEGLKSMIKNLEEQLISLYQDRQANPGDVEEMRTMVANLEECVVALTDDKMDLEKRNEEFHARMETMKKKGKALGAAIFEATLFTEGHEANKGVA
jgi:hypothetical protein